MNNTHATHSAEQLTRKQARLLIEQGDFTAAIELLTPFESGEDQNLIFSLNFAYDQRRLPGDRRKARALLERAASLGHTKAQEILSRRNLARRLIIKPTRFSSVDLSTDLIIQEAIKAYVPQELLEGEDLSILDSRTKCECAIPALKARSLAGDTIANRLLAFMYIHVFSGEEYYDEAIALLNESIDAGCGAAACTLGQIYQKGLGGPVNLTLAFESFELGMALGILESQFQVGNALLNGRGVTKDVQRAISVLEDASNKGHAYAPSLLARLMMKGEHMPTNEAKIIQLLKLSASRYCGIAASFMASYINKNPNLSTLEFEPEAYAMLAQELGEPAQNYRIERLAAADLPKVLASYKSIKAELNQPYN